MEKQFFKKLFILSSGLLLFLPLIFTSNFVNASVNSQEIYNQDWGVGDKAVIRDHDGNILMSQKQKSDDYVYWANTTDVRVYGGELLKYEAKGKKSYLLIDYLDLNRNFIRQYVFNIGVTYREIPLEQNGYIRFPYMGYAREYNKLTLIKNSLTPTPTPAPTPTPYCINECQFAGQTRCYDYWQNQTCGNYDSDSCLEWSSPQSYSSGNTYCGHGTCASDQRPQWYCSNGSFAYNCNFDSQCSGYYNDLNVSCYSSPNSVQTNQTITFFSSVSGGGGNYSYSWSGGCSGYSSTCQTSFSQSGNYTATLNVNSANQSRTASCGVAVTGDYNNNASGTLYVSSTTIYTGDPVTITITGYDSNGLVYLGAHYNNSWHQESVDGASSATRTWSVIQDSPGTYRYCGRVVSHQGQYWWNGQETTNTSPDCIGVTVLTRQQLCECSSGICCDGCHYKSAAVSCNVDIQTEYGCPWGSGCGADAGKRIRTRLQYCSGNSAQCSGSWGDWLSWTSWTISDACSSNEFCSIGQSQCQYSSACTQPSSYIKYFKKECYNNDLYWFDSNSLRQDKYKSCSDDNDCTIDNCQGTGCVNELKCDGTTCSIGSEKYCQSCNNHCGDKTCNCGETADSCSEDCKLGILISSVLGKKEGDPLKWLENIEVSNGENVNFMIVAINRSGQIIDNVVVTAEIPEGIVYKGDLKLDGAALKGDLVKGINIGSLEAGQKKVITFNGKINQTEGDEKEVVGKISAGNLSDVDSLKVAFTGSMGLAAIGSGTIRFFLQKWYFWLLVGIALLFFFFIVFRKLFSVTPV